MSGLAVLNKSRTVVVLGVVQLQLHRQDSRISRSDGQISREVAKARRNMGTMDLVVFPEDSLHGLSRHQARDHVPARRAEVAAFKHACVENRSGVAFRSMELNPTESIQQRHHHRRQGRTQALLPQAPSMGSGRAWEPGISVSRLRKATMDRR